jgi:dolichol-phosphate mannosyltransferase
MMTGLAVPGWTSMIITASFFGALNALGISILGEYVIRIYDQVRSRPVFVADSVKNRLQLPRQADRPMSSSMNESVDRLELLLESLEKEYRSPGLSASSSHQPS